MRKNLSSAKQFVAYFFALCLLLFLIKTTDLIIGLVDGPDIENSRSILLKEFPPNYDQWLTPSDARISETEGLQKKPYRLRTDKDGFIIGPVDLLESVKSSDVDIIFFGGSTTECKYVEEEQRFPYLVSQKLNGEDGQRIRVLNGGVSGAHSMHSLLSYLAKGLSYRPKYVVLMNVINDIGTLTKTLSYWDAPTSRALVQETRRTQERAGASEVSVRRFLVLLKDTFVPNVWQKVRHTFVGQILAGASHPNEVDEWAQYRAASISYSDIMIALEREYKTSLISFVRVSRAWGIEPILMTQVNRFNVDDAFIVSTYEQTEQPITFDDFIKVYSLGNDLVREVASREDVLLIDLDQDLEGTSEFVYDSIHMNTQGSQRVAEIIVSSLLEKYPFDFRPL